MKETGFSISAPLRGASRMAQKHRLLVTIPVDVRKWLRDRAAYNGGTQSGEVVRALREQMERFKSPPHAKATLTRETK